MDNENRISNNEAKRTVVPNAVNGRLQGAVRFVDVKAVPMPGGCQMIKLEK